MALCCVKDTTYIEDIRKRLREDINADLSDIVRKVKDDRAEAERRHLNRRLNKWFIELFSGDYEEAKRALTMCIALKPRKVVAPEEMTELLSRIWGSCEVLFDGDYSSLSAEIDRNTKNKQ